MPDPAQLAEQLHALADQVATLGAAAPGGPDEPAAEAPPAKPARPDATLGTGDLVLTWPAADDAAYWEVRDELDPNPATRVKDVVDIPRSVRAAFRPTSRPRRYVLVAIGPTGLRSEPSDPCDLPPVADTPATPSTPTAGVDLGRWKLTIPELGTDGKIREIRPPALASYTSRYFEKLDDGSLRFRVWHGGATTSGSSNPRSELRERVGDDPEGYWIAGLGRHSMEWTVQVNRLTKVKPHLVVGQVHDDQDDVVVWRIEADKLWLTNGDDPHGYLVDAHFILGRRYTCRYEITDGTFAFFYNGSQVNHALRSTAPSYFKVGAYLQSNPKSAPSESTDEYAEVVLHSVAVEHA